VPWQAIDAARREGLFQFLHEPGRVISPFPTMTNIGMNAMLGARPTLGYENLWFDREAGRMRGGAMKYIQRRHLDDERRGYNHCLDYEEPMQYEFLVYVLPERIFASDVSLMIDRFRRSEGPDFLAFLKSTDGVIHLGGREKLQRILHQLDAALAQLHEDYRGKLEIVIFSDHGNAIRPFSRVPLEDHLRPHGFEVSNRIRGPRSIIIPGFGLCSYAPIYTAEENRRPLAECLASVPGVDFAVFLPIEPGTDAANVTELIGRRGHARIRLDRERQAFRYEVVQGDVLALGPTMARLESEGRLSSDGYATDQVGFEATRDHQYPDALRNVWRSVREHVESRADVLVSFEDGSCYGSAIFDHIVTMKATHGSALQSTSYSVLASTAREVAPFLRPEAAAQFLRGTSQE
jgi:hypothetical protein